MTTSTQETAPEARAVPRLKARYRAEIAPALNTEFGFANVMQVPRLVKVVVNMGVGDAARDSKLIDGATRDLAAICLLYTSPSPRDRTRSRMPSSA